MNRPNVLDFVELPDGPLTGEQLAAVWGGSWRTWGEVVEQVLNKHITNQMRCQQCAAKRS